MTLTPSPVAASSSRQQELIAVAARLFAERGYYAVGINDITAELGLTGPAFYRHYRSKEALLIAVLDAAITSHLEEARSLVTRAVGPEATLNAIVEHHLAFVFDEAENIMTWRTEFRILPDPDRRRLMYLQRLYTEEWVRAVHILRPNLNVLEVRALCHATIALLQSPTQFHTELPRQEAVPLLSATARRALGLDSDHLSLGSPGGGAGRRQPRSVDADAGFAHGISVT